MTLPSLEAKTKNLTTDPGVYLMKSAVGEILYVGKAKNLKARVSTYFQESRDKPLKTELLVRRIVDFDVIITDNEVEALVLECNLIKKHKPKYNVRLKDDKTYPFVRLSTAHPFPRLEYVRRVQKDGARYFGPYVTSFQIKEVLKWAQKTFQLRDCSDNEFRNRSRPCILYQIQECSAPCVGLIDEAAYHANIKQVMHLLEGKTELVLSSLEAQMFAAAEREEFEAAAKHRDQMRYIHDISVQQKLTDPESNYDRDLVHFSRLENSTQGLTVTAGVVAVMSVREGKVVGVQPFLFDQLDPSIDDTEFLYGFLAQYYLARYEQTPTLLPKEVVLPTVSSERSELGFVDGLDQSKILARALGNSVQFRHSKRGELVELLAMLKKTCEHHLGELTKKIIYTVDDLIDVQRKLGLRRYPHRIECFDISHFQGEATVASRVVFIEGKPDKSLYRHYHVQSVDRPDDFQSMREILERRFSQTQDGDRWPDVVLIDGGRGQLSQVEAIFREFGVAGVELVSIAKARTKSDFQSTDVVTSLERIFKVNQKNPILLKPGTGAYRILTQARDEAHRFAITFHKNIRRKSRS